MKKQYIGIALWASLTLFASCSDFLQQDPANYVSDSGVIVDATSANAALNGAYHTLGNQEYYGGRYFDAGINLAGDNVAWTGSFNFYYDFNTHQYSAENQLLSKAWYGIYSTVNQANQVIDKTNALGNVSDSEKKRIVAEATVIRSLALFDLARTWGNIPVVKEATSSPTQFDGVKQTAAKDVYADIVNDILAVYANLGSPTDRVHINQAVADAFLARIYLYLQDYTHAEEYASKVIDNSYYQLGTIQDLIDSKQTNESIWELSFSSSRTNDQSAYWRSPNDGGRHEWGPSKELVGLLKDPTIGGDRKAFYADYSTSQVPDYYVGTLYHRATNDDNVILFRLAEQYLIRAEARAKKQSPDLEGALADLNKIRTRSHVASIEEPQTQASLIQAIEDENRVEFALEPHRWFDLVRTGRATEVLKIKDTQTVFPIPYNDILADQDLIQNKDY